MTQSFSYTGQVVTWPVPAGVTSLTIEARGAEGAANRNSGRGAIIRGTVSVTPAQMLSVLVGGQPQENRGISTAGGGGGSFVVTTSNNTLQYLVVAGGGGGGGNVITDSPAKHGQTGPAGGAATNSGGAGGTNQTGGRGGSGQYAASGGGGVLTNGSGNAGGQSFVNGGRGGRQDQIGDNAGFGGGGASFILIGTNGASIAGGGGGGYSGGGGASANGDGTGGGYGGGGGSYNGGTDQFAAVGATNGNSGNGLVTISYTPPPTITNFTVGPGSACVGDAITASLTVGNVSGSYSYTLTETNSTDTYQLTTSDNPASIRFVYDSPGVRSYTLRVVSNGQEATAGPRTVTINALPTQYNVTGGGSYCANTTGQAVGLSGSQSGVNYQLLQSDTPLGSPLPGTGNALNFGPQPAGTYTVQATNTSTSCQQTMTGSAVITAIQPPTVTLSNDGPITCNKPSVTLTAGGGNTYVFSAGATQVNGGNTATVTAAGTYTVTATNSTNGCSSFTTTSVSANTATPGVSNPSVTTATQNVAFSQTFTASGSATPYSFRLDSGSLPSGLTLSGNGALNGAPTQSGSFSFTVRATGANGCSGVGAVYTLTVNPQVTGTPTLTTPATGTITNSLPIFSGNAVSNSTVMVYVSGTSTQTLTTQTNAQGQFSIPANPALASGNYSAYAVAMLTGQTSSAPSNTNGFTVDATPPGVTLSASVGNGTTTMNQPTSFTARFSEAVTGFGPGGISVSNGSVSSFAGNGTTYSFNVSANAAGQVSVSIPANVAADGVGNSNTASASYSYTFQAPTITLSPPPGNLPGGTQGIAYSVTFSASGGSGTYTYALSGTPPPGMTLTDARLSGTPTASGIFRFRITATDNAAAPGPYSGSGEYTINIAPQPMTGMPSLSSPASGAVTNNNRPTYSGTAPANSTVTVFVNNASVGTTTATGAGSFSLQQPAALADGTYQVYVTAQLSGQSPSNSTNVNSFTVDTAVPSLTLSSAQVSNGGTTASSPVSFTAQFSEPVTGFSTSGISVSNGTVSNLQAQPGGTSYSFQVTASSAGPVSVAVNANAAQDAATNGNTASDSYGFTLTPGDFAIRSVDTRQCQLVDASRGEYRVSFTPVYSGLNGAPVSLRVINEVDATTAPGPYTIRLYSDNPTVTLLAQQAASSDARFSYAWLAACQGSVAPNRPPTTTGIPAQQLVQNQPYQLELTRYFADPDGQTLTYSSSALPAGLTLAGTTISGSPTAPGRTTVRITAIDPGGLSVATDVVMQVDAPPTTTPPAGFTITSVTDLTCVAVTATERRVSFSPVYSGLDGSSVRFRVVNEQDFGTTPGPYTLRLYTDNPAVTLEAVQAGQTATYRYDWLSACGSQTPPTVANRPPEVVVPIAPQSATAGQGYSFYVPANTFVDPEGELISLRTGPLPAGLSFSASLSAIIGTPAQAGTSTIQLTASDPAGQSVSLSFTLQVVAGAATPPTPPAGFTITGVGSVTCLSVSSTERRLSFFPQYTGVDGSPIRFQVVNEQDFGTAPGPYSLRLYTDNPAITLTATQGGSSASYRYNWLAACASPANGRQAVAEADSPLSVVVLGNPVIDGQLRLELRGVAGQPADLRLVSPAGQLLSQTFIESVVEGEPQTLGIRANWGTILLLQVRSGGQQQTIKVIQTR